MPKIKNSTIGTPYKTISEAAKMIGVAQYVLRFWESEFTQIQPQRVNGRRLYDQNNLDILLKIKHMLYTKGYTITGAKAAFNTVKLQNNTQTEALILRLKNLVAALS